MRGGKQDNPSICPGQRSLRGGGGGVGGGERGRRRFQECVRGSADAQTDSSEDVRKSTCALRAALFKCKRGREKKKEKKPSRHTPNSWDATNHTGVTRGAGSQSGLQPVQQDSWLL